MKNKNTWMVLIVICAFLAGIVIIYELRSPTAFRQPAVAGDGFEAYENFFNTPGVYRSVGHTPEPLKGEQTLTNLPAIPYTYQLGMKPGRGSAIEFDLFVFQPPTYKTYPSQVEIDNGINTEGWVVSAP